MRKTFAVLTLLFTLLPPLSYAEQVIPATPAGKVLAAMITALNKGKPEDLAVFVKNNDSSRLTAERMINIHDITGDLNVVRMERSTPYSLKALLKEADSDFYGTIELSVSTDKTHKLLYQDFNRVPMPADLAPQRLSLNAAVAALKQRADQLAAEDKFSGVLLITHNDKTLLSGAWGYSDKDARQAIDIDTKFRIGSMNKMFTSVAILQLIDAGRLQLSDTVGNILPGYANKEIAETVTVRQLLTHTGGTGDIFVQEFYKNQAELKEHTDYVRLFENRAPLFKPGARFGYSNYGYVLLGAIIEQVSGMSYYDYVQKAIFAPAGMNDTGSLPENIDVPGRAKGYMKVRSTWTSNAKMLPYRGTSTGGGYSTANDLLRFAQNLQSGRLLSLATLEQATSDQAEHYGYGFFVQGAEANRMYGHSGGAGGMNGELSISHQAGGYVVIALSNLDPTSASRLYNYFTLRMPIN
ncbi:serine hydrolase domain-containing protein [Undibacterium terreum]|uniref:Beta-lactamase-related domain-containing protein n=1 Tax=Undibacterium terreum TaxID=1224302 RepID=A0A916U8X0_9BURK|nr:serine hydrolase domain-containing protein [Undibacterium terreum]GGC64830.1 hypothetical protein GCM10011396_09820 [Undibacterium terreum]